MHGRTHEWQDDAPAENEHTREQYYKEKVEERAVNPAPVGARCSEWSQQPCPEGFHELAMHRARCKTA